MQEGSCDEASSVAASRWAPDLGMEEIRLQVALLILEESPADTVCFFSLLPDDSKIIPFGSFTHLQTFTDHCRIIYRCR